MVGLQKHRVQIQQMVDGILIKMAEVRRYRNGLVSDWIRYATGSAASWSM